MPTIYGGGLSHADMRDISNVLGSMEAQMMNAATIEMGNYYKIPTGTGAIFGYSDSKMNDYQCGAESAMSQMLLALSGVKVVYGLGELAGMDANSLEKIVMDHELFKSVKKLTQGINVSEETLAFDVIEKIGPEGDFLNNEHTFKWFRKEYLFAEIFNRQGKSTWENDGSIDIQTVATNYVKEVLTESSLNKLSPEKDKELDRVMNDILKSRGFKLEDYLSLLPE